MLPNTASTQVAAYYQNPEPIHEQYEEDQEMNQEYGDEQPHGRIQQSIEGDQ